MVLSPTSTYLDCYSKSLISTFQSEIGSISMKDIIPKLDGRSKHKLTEGREQTNNYSVYYKTKLQLILRKSKITQYIQVK